MAKSLNKPLTEVELDVAMKQLDSDGSGSVNFDEFKLFWREKFGGQVVEGTKLAAIMAQWSDLNPIDGVAYHPDRYVDKDDEFRARVWATFEKIDSNGDHEISYIEFIKCVFRLPFCPARRQLQLDARRCCLPAGGKGRTKQRTAASCKLAMTC